MNVRRITRLFWNCNSIVLKAAVKTYRSVLAENGFERNWTYLFVIFRNLNFARLKKFNRFLNFILSATNVYNDFFPSKYEIRPCLYRTCPQFCWSFIAKCLVGFFTLRKPTKVSKIRVKRITIWIHRNLFGQSWYKYADIKVLFYPKILMRSK